MDVIANEHLLDEARLDELTEEIGAEDLADVLLMFLDEAAEQIARIALGLGDDEHAKATHFVRSGALNIGLAALAGEAGRAACAEAPQRAASGNALAGTAARSRAAVLARWG